MSLTSVQLNIECKWEWTTTHSFFACMGGFVLDHTSYSTKLECPSLTMEGVLYTAMTQPGLLDFSEAQITDRSRADALSKALVCTQAAYVLVQVLARLRAALPVTLLEINTVCHIVCAFAMYSFWFHKPLDVRETISVQPRWAEDFDAIYSMRLRRFEISWTRRLWHDAVSRFTRNNMSVSRRIQRLFKPESCIFIFLPTEKRKDVFTPEPIEERYLFDAFRAEALHLLLRRQDRVILQARDAMDQGDGESLVWWCLRCGHPKPPVHDHPTRESRPMHRSRPVISLALKRRGVSYAADMLPASYAADMLPAVMEHESSSPQELESIAISSLSYIPLKTDNESLKQRWTGYLNRQSNGGLFELDALPPYQGDVNFLGLPSGHVPFVCCKSGRALDDVGHHALIFPEREEWIRGLTVKRGMPDIYEMGTWNHGIALIWHSIKADMDDDTVQKQLFGSKLWSAVTSVYLVQGHVANKCLLRDSIRKPSKPGQHDFAVGDRHIVCAVALDSAGIRRWERAFEIACNTEAESTYDETAMTHSKSKGKTSSPKSLIMGFQIIDSAWTPAEANAYATDQISNWPKFGFLSSQGRKAMPRFAIAFATAVYGGIHAAAWHVDHPTQVEALLWKVSSVFVAASGALLTPALLLYLWLQKAGKLSESDDLIDNKAYLTALESGLGLSSETVVPPDPVAFQERDVSWKDFTLENIFGGWLLVLLAWVVIAYSMARAYLIVEAFISLRSLPPGAFETPNWTTVLLHW